MMGWDDGREMKSDSEGGAERKERRKKKKRSTWWTEPSPWYGGGKVLKGFRF